MTPKLAAVTLVSALAMGAEAASSTPYLRKLASDTSSETLWGNGAFADGTETVYDDNSLAWRLLGFYQDCDVCVKDNNDNNNHDNEDIEDDPTECLKDGQDTTVCRRYALWAAYVDVNYEGNGPSEYQHYDLKNHRWDKSNCEDDQRCAKLDCHNPGSRNFSLLGVYKDPKVGDLLDNLVSYSGDCVWSDRDYQFMTTLNNDNDDDNNNGVAQWPPSGCTAYQNANGVVVYYDAVPTAGGRLEVGLFVDASCSTPYEGKEIAPKEVLGRPLSDLRQWNAALDALKVCRPCVSYETLFDGAEQYNQQGDRYGSNEENNQKNNDDDAADDDEAKEDEEPFVCRDNLDEEDPVNQCQVLMEEGKDSMSVATYRDILVAESQGTVTGIDMSSERRKMVLGDSFIKPRHYWLSILLLILSMGYFGCALSRLFHKDRSKHGSNGMDEPLVGRSTEAENHRQKTANRKSSSGKSVSTTAAVTGATRKNKNKDEQQRKAEQAEKNRKREEKKRQQQVSSKKKSILKKPKRDDEDDEWSSGDDSTHYSAYR